MQIAMDFFFCVCVCFCRSFLIFAVKKKIRQKVLCNGALVFIDFCSICYILHIPRLCSTGPILGETQTVNFKEIYLYDTSNNIPSQGNPLFPMFLQIEKLILASLKPIEAVSREIVRWIRVWESYTCRKDLTALFIMGSTLKWKQELLHWRWFW